MAGLDQICWSSLRTPLPLNSLHVFWRIPVFRSLSHQELHLSKKLDKSRHWTKTRALENKHKSRVACNTCFTRSRRKHSHFHLFDHDRRFSLLDATRTYRRVGPTPFSCVFRSQTVQSSLPWHRINSNWCDMGQLCACDNFSIHNDAFKYNWYNIASLSIVFLGHDVHCRGKNSVRLPFGSLQGCGDWGYVGYLFFYHPTSDHAVDQVWRLRRNRIRHAV